MADDDEQLGNDGDEGGWWWRTTLGNVMAQVNESHLTSAFIRALEFMISSITSAIFKNTQTTIPGYSGEFLILSTPERLKYITATEVLRKKNFPCGLYRLAWKAFGTSCLPPLS
jgi:hypothetical protein